MRSTKLLLPLPLLLAAAACQPQPKYYWGDYSSSLRSYYIDASEQKSFDQALDTIVVSADTSGRKVPPGVFAEYGYEELSHGNTDKAVQLFQREKQAWPESTVFMDKAIASAKTGQKSVAPDAAPPQSNGSPSAPATPSS
jgi:hypothetical protein